MRERDSVPFDQVAGEYERYHNRYLPPVVRSGEFVGQKTGMVDRWVARYFEAPAALDVLDFGCGTGRILLDLARRAWCRSATGVDASAASLQEARTAADAAGGPAPIRLAARLEDLDPASSYHVIVAFNVFHHIAPPDRPTVVAGLVHRLTPTGILAVWEHNPWNPFARLLVGMCPFDRGARLLSLSKCRCLFERGGVQCRERAYVNLLPPHWQAARAGLAVDRAFRRAPLGAQYWLVFGR